MPRKPRQPTGFRIVRKAFGLTYSCPRRGGCSQLPDGEHCIGCECEHPIKTHEELISFLESKGPNRYIIGKESHKSGKTHWHVCVKYDEVIDSTNPRFFDVNGAHPRIELKPPGPGWELYCTKEKDFKTGNAPCPRRCAGSCLLYTSPSPRD